MFVGAINSTVREFLGNVASVFDGQQVVVGCSGNFTSEAVISQRAKPAAVHSNDISFYSCMAGRWLTGQPLEFKIADPDFDWLVPYLGSDVCKLASIMVLLDMLEHAKQNNPHRVRMWRLYRDQFPTLLAKTVDRLTQVDIRVTTYFAGDVWEHFKRFGDRDDAVFCCYAPTYAGGYERMYKELDKIIDWDAPHYEMLDDKRRDGLLSWMAERRFLWYDDRIIPNLRPVMQQQSGRNKTVYLYSNAVNRTAVFMDMASKPLPKLPLADGHFTVNPDSRITLFPIKTSDLARFKDAYLGKNIAFGSGMWAFAVMIDGKTVGFLEFTRGKYTIDEVYMQADFAIPTTRYARMSKLMVMLAVSGETRRALERLSEARKRTVCTTAFTDRPVSMKYRGVLDLVKRGETKEGQKFLNYCGVFNTKSWQETLQEWLTKHGSQKS